MRLALALVGLLASGVARAAAPAPVEGMRGMVASSQRLASEAGAMVLREGGNAVDAAVATAWAEAVVNPCCGNLGGGGFLVARLGDGRAVFLDFRETAPAGATADMYLDAAGQPVKDASLVGWKAVAVPGSVLGLETARERWGTLPRAALMAPAIQLAREGFVLTRGDADILESGVERLRRDPQAAGVFLHADGSPLGVGERLVQPALAGTLAAISERGAEAFYKGAVAEAVGAGSKAGGGVVTAADLAAYRVGEGEPVQCGWRGLTVLSAPPPSSGGVTLCEALGILDGYDLKAMGWHSAAAVRAEAEALRQAFLDRNTLLGDPAFVSNPVGQLLSPEYEAGVRARIAAGGRPAAAGALHEGSQTTHISVADRHGGMAALTYTINALFGAGVVAPGTGVLLNDEMDDFTTAPGKPNMFGLVQGAANAIAPGKRPLSSMAPTLVLREGRPWLAVGSPGGSRIITIVLEALLDREVFGMGPQEAVDAPRLHFQGVPNTLFVEPWAVSADTREKLAGEGYKIVEQTPWGAAEMVEFGQPAAKRGVARSGNDAESGGELRAGWVYGAHDSRRPAGAAVAE